MPYFIYILKLVDGKYYVGLAKDLFKRLEQHFNRKGSKWTTLYQPISVEKVIESDSCFDEDKWTKIVMQKHGIRNVRGGSYTSIELQPEVEKLLEREERTRNQACFECGRKGHFAKECSNYSGQRKRRPFLGLYNSSKKKVGDTTFKRFHQHQGQICLSRQQKQHSQQIPSVQPIKIQSSDDEEYDQFLQQIRSQPSKILKKITNAIHYQTQSPALKQKGASE